MTRPVAVVFGVALALASSGRAGSIPPGRQTHTDPQHSFRISYPAGWRVDPRWVYVGFGPDHEIRGIAFEVPENLTKGSNLSSSLTGVSVEQRVASGTCDATRFIPEPQDLHTLRNGGRVWSTANTGDAGAGNFYDIAVFALPGTSPCLAVRYTIHSTAIGNYDPGTVEEFDRPALIRTFARIRQSLRLAADP